MAKRFTDTDIWEQDWFIALPSKYKHLWSFIKDKCDDCGAWRPNKGLLELTLGEKIDLNEFLSLINTEEKTRILVLENGRWFLKDFFFFQYGDNFNPHSPVHRGVLKRLVNNGITLQELSKVSVGKLLDADIQILREIAYQYPKDTLIVSYQYPINRVKDKDKDKDIDTNSIKQSNSLESIESKDSSEKQVFAEDEKKVVEEKVCNEVATVVEDTKVSVKKVKSKSKKDPDAEPYWKDLVKIWFSFNIEKFGEKPSFTGQDPSHMHRIIEQLKKRAEEQNVEWTIQEATERWRRFLYNAFFDEWLSHNFLLQNLFTKKDIIFLNQKQLKNGTHQTTPRPLPRSEGAIKLLDQLAADIGINR